MCHWHTLFDNIAMLPKDENPMQNTTKLSRAQPSQVNIECKHAASKQSIRKFACALIINLNRSVDLQHAITTRWDHLIKVYCEHMKSQSYKLLNCFQTANSCAISKAHHADKRLRFAEASLRINRESWIQQGCIAIDALLFCDQSASHWSACSAFLCTRTVSDAICIASIEALVFEKSKATQQPIIKSILCVCSTTQCIMIGFV